MQSPSNNRAGSRFLTLFELKIRNAKTGQDLGMLVDASRNGLCVVASEALVPEAEIELEIDPNTLQGKMESQDEPIRGTAIVRWCRSNRAAPGLNVIGMEFMHFDSSASEQAFMALISRDCIAVWGASGLAVPPAQGE